MNRSAGWVLGLLLAGPALAAHTDRYVALVDNGKVAGHLVAAHGDDGATHVDFVFKDNGRGPELQETYTLAADGTFSRYQAKGTSTFGAPTEESFARTGDTVRWQSKSDHGEQAVQGTAMYTPLGGSPAAFSVALSALAQRADGRLPLIPSGPLPCAR